MPNPPAPQQPGPTPGPVTAATAAALIKHIVY